MSHYRQTWVEIDLSAIYENVQSIKREYAPKQDVMAVVKADGYGHGAIEVAQTALKAGATWLGVALLEEAIELREAGFNVPILVLGYIEPSYIDIAQKYDISVTIPDVTYWERILSHINEQYDALKFHLKLDTGMHRIGLTSYEQLQQFIALYKETTTNLQASVIWEGAYTHLATADEEEVDYFEKQLAQFKQMLSFIQDNDIHPSCIHLANSAAIFRKVSTPLTTLVRLGISMYGLSPSTYMQEQYKLSLKPAFRLKSRLSQVKQLKPDSGVSYGLTYKTKQNEWIGTIPIGYADGYTRLFSNKVNVIVEGKKLPVVGRICMDQTMIKLDQPYEQGTEVTLIGELGGERVTADELAEAIGTINYEIPCMITKRVPRKYVNKC